MRTILTAGGLVLALGIVAAVGSANPGSAKRVPPVPTGLAGRASHRGVPGTTSSLPTSIQTAGATTPSPTAPLPTSAPPTSSTTRPSTPASTHAPAATSPPPTTVAPSPTTTIASLGFPIRAAFYYPWFPEGWDQQGMDPFTWYHPSLGFYSQDDPSVVAEQIQAMQYGNIQVGIASWWGQGSPTDGRIPLLLQEAAGTGFKWTLYYEAGGNAIAGEAGSPNPTVAQIQSDLTYIDAHYASNPNYLHVDGKPVIFVYGGPSSSCATTANWAQANTLGFYVNIKVFPGYQSCPFQPDGWHQYNPSQPDDSQSGYSFSISPGFDKANESSPRLVRDPSMFAADAQLMVNSGAPWQLVTTFNEWGEGTAVESAQEWASPSGYGTYLDILHAVP
jgi:hypothetical protein